MLFFPGTGKSFLIKVLQQQLNASDGVTDDRLPTCVLAAPTGVAAANIGGRTIHSCLKLPIQLNLMKTLDDKAAAVFRNNWQRTRYLIIDERSMIGCRLLHAIDKRLRETTLTNKHVSFGGLSVILIGDHF